MIAVLNIAVLAADRRALSVEGVCAEVTGIVSDLKSKVGSMSTRRQAFFDLKVN
jgi:hypothetical protein